MVTAPKQLDHLVLQISLLNLVLLLGVGLGLVLRDHKPTPQLHANCAHVALDALQVSVLVQETGVAGGREERQEESQQHCGLPQTE